MKTKLLYITIFCLLIIQACKRDNTDSGCPSYSTNYKTLTLEAINQTPYFTNPAFDTISFASDKGDTVIFVKAKTDTAWYCENDNSNADCPKENANCYQVLHNSYTTIKGVGNLDIKHSKKTIEFPDLIEITFNDLHFKVRDYRIGLKEKPYFLSIVKGNKTYYNVIIIYPNLNESTIAEAFINIENGCFNFRDKSTNTEYNLISK